MAENKTPDANYKGRSDIVIQEDTILDASASATARAQHVAKMDAKVTAMEAAAATAYGGAATAGSIKRGK